VNILVPNLGSTSVKYQIIELPSERSLARGALQRIGRPGGDAASYRHAIEAALNSPHTIDAVGFKAVHAGPRFRGTFPVDDALLAALREFEPAAPLHNGIYLSGIEIFRELRPELPLVAVLETGFHRSVPEKASTYGVPRAWADEHGVRRYGFHGASHRYIAERLPPFLGRDTGSLRMISCHLGGSSSVCAVAGGESRDVTMGFSPQSGIENATRHGDLDAFAVLFMMERLSLSSEQMRQLLLAEGGLAGISGVAGGDVRDIEQAAATGDVRAALALDVFTYEIKKTIGAYAAALGGLDAVAFTGGIGENDATLRAKVLDGLAFLGLQVDPEANEGGSGDRLISPSGAGVSVAVLATNEELVVARESYALLNAS